MKVSSRCVEVVFRLVTGVHREFLVIGKEYMYIYKQIYYMYQCMDYIWTKYELHTITFHWVGGVLVNLERLCVHLYHI